MKVYIIRDTNKDIQLVTRNSDKAIDMINKNKNFMCIPYNVEDDEETQLKPLSDFGEKQYFIHHPNSEIRFGKHKGCTVIDVIIKDPKWVQWAKENCNLKLDEECENLLQQALDKGEKK